MELKLSFTNLESTPAIEERIKEKCERLTKYLEGRFVIDWNCTIEKNDHLSSVTVHGKGFDYHANAREDNLYKTIDSALDKLEKQMAKKKDMLTNKHHEKLTSAVKFDE